MSAMRTVFMLGLVLVVTAPARAEPYWVAWEGNDYPENEGWRRVLGDENGHGQGGSNRSITDGAMTLDSMRNHMIYDYYQIDRLINPDANELFVAEWRLRVVDSVGPLPDQCVSISRDGAGALVLCFDLGGIWSQRENWRIPVSPDEFHAFRLESADMLTYSLFIDDQFVHQGVWDLESFNESYVAFGDTSYGGTVRSKVDWDFVRFGVVPEPSPILSILAPVPVWLLLTRRNR